MYVLRPWWVSRGSCRVVLRLREKRQQSHTEPSSFSPRRTASNRVMRSFIAVAAALALSHSARAGLEDALYSVSPSLPLPVDVFMRTDSRVRPPRLSSPPVTLTSTYSLTGWRRGEGN